MCGLSAISETTSVWIACSRWCRKWSV